MRILVVDDHDANRETLANVLTKMGHDVDTAVGGGRAIEKALRTRPDLMVLDMVLPTVSGRDVLAATVGVPVVVWTGVLQGGEADLPGVVAVVEKPNVEALLAAIEKIRKAGASDRPGVRP